MSAYVLKCREEDFDAQTGTCADPYYGPMPTVIPELSIEDGTLIAVAIASMWTLGLIARVLIRASRQQTG